MRSPHSTSNHQRVVCPEPLAAAAAGQVLERGGNAVDGAVTAAFVQGVVNPLMCGLGGTASLLVYHAESQAVRFLEGRPGAGAKASSDSYRYVAPSVYSNRYVVDGFENYIGHKAVTIPTYVRALSDAHTRYGRLPWRDLLQPAIELAADGFEVYPYIHRMWDTEAERFSDSPAPVVRLNATEECARIYLKDAQVYAVGDRLRQTDYATTLERIADEGADVFYRGAIARAIADDFRANGGFITREDLAMCDTRFYIPVIGTYRDYTIATSGPPGMGQSHLQALNIIEQLDLERLGWGSPRYFGMLARVFQTIYADRVRFNGDPDYQVVPLEMFLSKDRAWEQAREIEGQSGPSNLSVSPMLAAANTTHVSVVDRWGNAATVTHSNGNSSGVVTPGLGFLYNNHMHNFDARPGHRNSVAPGKKAQYACPPIMMFRDGDLRLVSGSLSRFKVTADLQATLSVIDFGQDVATAIHAPRIHAEYDPDTIYAEPGVSSWLLGELENLGWKIKVITMTAPLCMIVRDPNGATQTAADPRGGGGVWPPL